MNSNIRALDVPVKPVAPSPPAEPKQPEKPDVKASYHYDLLYARAGVEKIVSDQDNTDIHDKAVKTGMVVKFALHTSNLPAGHEKMESLVFQDVLPDGYHVNLEETRQGSEDYDVAYDTESRQLTFTATPTLLEQLNHDPGQEVAVPAPVITGTVTKEGTTYVNDFDLTINNQYSVKSKPVRVHTPAKPRKEVFRGSQTTNIDGKTVKEGEEIRYEITYRNTTGSKQTAVITDNVPRYTTFLSADNGGTESNGIITWVKEVEQGQSWTVRFRVKVDQNVNGKPVDNAARVRDSVNESETNQTHNPTPAPVTPAPPSSPSRPVKPTSPSTPGRPATPAVKRPVQIASPKTGDPSQIPFSFYGVLMIASLGMMAYVGWRSRKRS